MLFYSSEYKRPMKAFLNRYMSKNRHLKLNSADELIDIFFKTIGIVRESISEKAFRPERALNAAVFDAVTTGIAKRLMKGPVKDKTTLVQRYDELLSNSDFIKRYKTATSDEENVKTRLKLAIEAFEDVI